MSPKWSRNGQWIYFTKKRSGQLQLWKMRAKGGEAAPVTPQGGEVTVESPDGKVFYHARNRNPSSLWKVLVAGGEESLVLDSLSDPQKFVVMDQGIYFILASGDRFFSNASIQFYNFASGKTQLIAKLEKPAHVGLTVSPDRRWILYTQNDESGSDLMLVENFR
ncbi:MAG: DUF5050 domain-containing protein [Acidobacteria bacterium]|nr:DUF5050 domain-containing protein [Acidobacteriota bacterium]